MSEHGEGHPTEPQPPVDPGQVSQPQQPPTPPQPGQPTVIGQPTPSAPQPPTPQAPPVNPAPQAPAPQAPQTPPTPGVPPVQAPRPAQAPPVQAPPTQAPPAQAPPAQAPRPTAPAPAPQPVQAPSTQPAGYAAAPSGYQQPQQAPPPKKKSKVPIIGGAVAAVALLGGGAFAVFGGGSDDDTAAVAPDTTVAVTTTVTPETTVETAPPTTDPPSVSDLAQSSVQIILLSDDGTPLCSGSGTFVDADGTILTNAHVVSSDSGCPFSRIGIAVTMDSGLPPELLYEADLLAVDTELDLAVVRTARNADGSPINGLAFPTIPIGDSDAVEIGDAIRILGYPSIGGDTITFTNGSVSGFTAQAGVSDRSWIKTDATISGGNSGGTAVDDEGFLVGVPTQAAASQDGPIVDCRLITDTNGDGRLTEEDTCVPIGGFLNGLRPINLAKPLIEEARTATPMALEDNAPPEPSSDFDVSGVRFFRPGFSLGIAEPQSETEFVVSATAGVESICVWFNWDGFADGAAWDAVWRVEGEIVEEYSFLGEIWEGGVSGADYWLCAIDDDGGLDAGLYEMVFFVEGQLAFSEAIVVTPTEVPVHEVEFVNELGEEVCFLRVNPVGAVDFGLDDLGASQSIPAGESASVFLPEGEVIAQAQNCAGETIGGDSNGFTIDSAEPIVMTPPG